MHKNGTKVAADCYLEFKYEVTTIRRAGLVLRWVTVRGYTVSVNQATQANST